MLGTLPLATYAPNLYPHHYLDLLRFLSFGIVTCHTQLIEQLWLPHMYRPLYDHTIDIILEGGGGVPDAMLSPPDLPPGYHVYIRPIALVVTVIRLSAYTVTERLIMPVLYLAMPF